MTRVEAAEEWGVHVNSVSRIKHELPTNDVLQGTNQWWVRRDTDYRPRRVGRPSNGTSCLRRRRYYTRYIPSIPDLRKLISYPEARELWWSLIDRLIEDGPEEFLRWYESKDSHPSFDPLHPRHSAWFPHLYEED
jgi:hypothetical protein